MKEEWLFPNAVVPVDVETTAALVAEIHRLIGVVGNMALAQPEQEPVAWEQFHGHMAGPFYQAPLQEQRSCDKRTEQEPVCPECKAEVLYECVACSRNNYPPQRTWVGLEEEEIRNLWEEVTKPDRSTMTLVTSFARAIEAKLKERNT